MSDHRTARLLTLSLLICMLKSTCAQYEVPDVTIQLLNPRGFTASIPDAPQMSLFAFQGNINRPIKRNDVCEVKGEILKPTNGRWTFQDLNLELKVGDVINYYVVVIKDGVIYITDDFVYRVNGFDSQISTNSSFSTRNCSPSVTQLLGGTVCSGRIIFEDNFDNFNENVWQIEHFIPVYLPERPFVSYQRLTADPTVYVANGSLHIVPKLQQELPGYSEESIYTGNLTLLNGCTGEPCMKKSHGSDILPPIVSGRITSKGFIFKYGTVTIRAKLPQGDWLYPEIFLEPFLNKYGRSHYSSGLIKIASARGNRELSNGSVDYSNKVLYGGVIMNDNCADVFVSSIELQDGHFWGDRFREYTVNWTPDYINLSVDGTEWARIEPRGGGLRNHFPTSCTDLPSSLLAMGSKIAPFDDFFYITLGVGAGSVTEFPNDVRTTSGHPKPWSNHESKAVLRFWLDMMSWRATWDQPRLLVDYIRVVAL